MARYKLVRQENGLIVTGDELKAELLEEVFTVPVLVPYEPDYQLLPKPVKPTTRIIADWQAYHTAYKAYELERLTVNAENVSRKIAYFKQFADLAADLSVNFLIADGVYVRRTKDTAPYWKYIVYGTNIYTFNQAAEKLLKGGLGIDFICFNYFGS